MQFRHGYTILPVAFGGTVPRRVGAYCIIPQIGIDLRRKLCSRFGARQRPWRVMFDAERCRRTLRRIEGKTKASDAWRTGGLAGMKRMAVDYFVGIGR
ncbi:hypothetical protein D3C71_1791880 [compost metagenome]